MSTETTETNTAEDLSEYITILKSVDMLHTDFELETATPTERADVLGKFNAWIEQGKPRPTMPEQKADKKQVLRAYRVKAYGKEYLYYRTPGEVIPIGVKQIPVYRKVKDESGKLKTDKTTVIRWDREYQTPYSDAKAKKLVERCNNESPRPQFHLVYAERTYSCTPDNFTGDFDTLIQKVTSGKPI